MKIAFIAFELGVKSCRTLKTYAISIKIEFDVQMVKFLPRVLAHRIFQYGEKNHNAKKKLKGIIE
jgi:hypothetical protein